MQIVSVTNTRTGSVLTSRAELCKSPWSRFRGLMLRASLPPGHGILLAPCGSVHTAMMRFAIDVVYVDTHGKVAKVAPRLRPYRVSFGGRGAHAVIELPAGTVSESDLQVGDVLAVTSGAGEPVSV